MKEPERLFTSSDSPLERALLRAGRPIRPPHAAKARAVAAAAAVVATAGLTTTGAAASGILAKLASVVGVRWLAVVAIASVCAGGAAVGVFRERKESQSRVAASEPAASESRQGIVRPFTPSSASVPGPPVLTSPEPGIASSSPSPSPSPSPSTSTSTSQAPRQAMAPAEVPSGSAIRDELAWLDGARGAIRAGDPARGLSLLEGYRARFPRGVMAPEATMLRIEALVDAGDRPAAMRAADAFLAANPGSPYAPRVHSLLGDNQ